MKTKTILFDFDGTIADTVDIVVEILNEMSKEIGRPPMTPEELEGYRNKRNQEALKDTGVPGHKVFWILRKVWSEINSRIPELSPVDGIKEALVELKRSDFKLGIVTTGSKDNVLRFLESNGLDMFEFVYAGKTIFGKRRALKKTLKKEGLNKENTIYVGDQTSDIEAAFAVGIRTVAVGWGFNREKILKEQNPDYFIKEPKELVKIAQAL